MDPISAIVNKDFEAAESLRGTLDSHQVSTVVARYWASTDRDQRDVAVHLIQDCDLTDVEAVMRDALKSPTVATRAIALCSLKKDFTMFEQFLKNGLVDASLVDAAIQSACST